MCRAAWKGTAVDNQHDDLRKSQQVSIDVKIVRSDDEQVLLRMSGGVEAKGGNVRVRPVSV